MNESQFATQVEPAEWEIHRLEGCKGIYFKCNLPVVPAVRQNRNTRWGAQGKRAQDYNAARAAIADLLSIAMKQENIEPFPKEARLRLILNVRKGGFDMFLTEHGRLPLPKGSLKGDWDNLAKCVGDAVQGVAFANDAQIDEATVGVLR